MSLSSPSPESRPSPPDTMVPDHELRLQRQLAYYFSNKNLWRDAWLAEQLGGPECVGWLDVSVLLGFRRVQQITSDVDVVKRCLERMDSSVEVRCTTKTSQESRCLVRRLQPLPPRPADEVEVTARPTADPTSCTSTGRGEQEDDGAHSSEEQELQFASTTAMDGPQKFKPRRRNSQESVHSSATFSGGQHDGRGQIVDGESADHMHQIPGFRQVPKTGVIYVMDEAAKHGYSAATAPQWANLGQGSPETTHPKHWPTNVRNQIQKLVADGKLDSELGPWEEIKQLEMTAENLHYGNVNGDLALRSAVASFYNEMYRKGKKTTSSMYTAENVALVGGGRLALTRLCTAMDQINLGHFLPDYTAYTELLSGCKNVTPIPIPLDPANNFRIALNDLKREIVGKGLSALLLSNPCNPTGQLVEGEELKSWVRIARETSCSLVLDEIYSRYVYTQRMAPTDASWRMVSAAQFVEDVNKDPVIILDGLTKNWRMPGLRVCWIVAPKSVIEAVGAAGSFLDGGASLPTQRAIVPFLNPKLVIQQTVMLQLLFSHKRDFLLKRLHDMGIVVEHPPQGTFYCWCDVRDLPAPLNNCEGFFRTMLKNKVIVCPGVFFDVNPGQRRKFRQYQTFVRLSYGPSIRELKRGLDAMERVVVKCREEALGAGARTRE